jgi:hypothetical protein
MSEPSIYQIPSLQTAAFITRIRKTFEANQSDDPGQKQYIVGAVMSDFNNALGREIAKWEPISEGDPPFSAKLNYFFSDLELDTTVLASQIETLSSAMVATHNLIKTEILHGIGENARLNNKMKTLQLYSTSVDNNMYVFGDSFISNELIDRNASPTSTAGEISGDGTLTLAKTAVSADPLVGAKVEVLPSSNGFLGNNQEYILAETTAELVNKGGSFVGQTNRHARLEEMVDNLPTTWIEYENILLSENDKAKAGNFNFKYIDDVNTTTRGRTVKWGDGPEDGLLVLDLMVTLKKPTVMNIFKLMAHELMDKDSHPIKIASVQVSSNKTDWELITPEDMWLTTEINVDTVKNSSNMSVGTAIWKFAPRLVSYIRITVEQSESISIDVGHPYFMTKEQVVYRRKDGKDAPVDTIDPSGALEKVIVPPKRAEGPIPPLSNPFKFYQEGRQINNMIESIEVFPGKRWVIALRDISGSETTYANKSVIVSKKFELPKIIDRVVLESDVEIASDFSAGSEWVKFFVSPNNGVNWYQISRVQDTYNDVPEILAFNDPTPVEFRDQNVGYYDTTGTVNSLRVKIELSRPADNKSITPIVRGYKLKIRTRD